MNIQANYNQPTFRASFSKDRVTTDILKDAVKDSAFGGYPVYLAIKSLNNLNTEDALSIYKPGSQTWIIRNTRTGDFIRISRLQDKFNKNKDALPNIYTCNGRQYYDLPGALCDSIGKNAGILFNDLRKKDKVLKKSNGPIFNLSAPHRSEFQHNANEYRLNNKIAALKAQIKELESKKIENGKNYTLSLIG